MKIFAGNNHPQIEISLSASNTALQALLDKKLTEQSSVDDAMKFVNQWVLARTSGAYGKYGVRGTMYTWCVYG